MESQFQAILFDNDGVLVDTERLYYEANRQVLKDHYLLERRDYIRFFMESSAGISGLIAELSLPCSADDLRIKRDACYAALLQSEDILISGVQEAIAELAANFRLAIVSSSSPEHFKIIHQRSGLLKYFETAITREQYQESKPDPEPYLLALKQLRLSAHDCLVIEDSPRGIEAAARAGIEVWQIDSTMQPASTMPPKQRFRTLAELLPTLLNRTSKLA